MCKHDQVFKTENESFGGWGCPLCHRERRAAAAMPPAFSDMIIVETCPVCGVQFVTAQSGPFICSDCLAEQAAYEADRADNARPYLS